MPGDEDGDGIATLKMNFPIILFEPQHTMKDTLGDTLVKRLQSVTMQMAVENLVAIECSVGTYQPNTTQANCVDASPRTLCQYDWCDF